MAMINFNHFILILVEPTSIHQINNPTNFKITVGNLLPQATRQLPIIKLELSLNQASRDRKIRLTIISRTTFRGRSNGHQGRLSLGGGHRSFVHEDSPNFGNVSRLPSPWKRQRCSLIDAGQIPVSMDLKGAEKQLHGVVSY